jgi:hypothetical protein
MLEKIPSKYASKKAGKRNGNGKRYRALRAKGWSLMRIARKFGVTHQAVAAQTTRWDKHKLYQNQRQQKLYQETKANMFKVTYNIPMPQKRALYPFDSMRIGGSFEVLGEPEARKARNAAYQYSKKHSAAFALRKISDGKKTPIYRLWRTK